MLTSIIWGSKSCPCIHTKHITMLTSSIILCIKFNSIVHGAKKEENIRKGPNIDSFLHIRD